MNANLGHFERNSMKTSQFVGITVWASILIIVFGTMSGVFKSNFTTWFFFVFLCIVALCAYGDSQR